MIFLAGNFVEGLGAGEDQTIPTVFKRTVGDPAMEVINLNASGTDPMVLSLLANVAIPALKPTDP